MKVPAAPTFNYTWDTLVAKGRSWLDYVHLNEKLTYACELSRSPVDDEVAKLRQAWGVRTSITIVALVPDLLLPILFAGAWLMMLIKLPLTCRS
jgi:hypothetical protein